MGKQHLFPLSETLCRALLSEVATDLPRSTRNFYNAHIKAVLCTMRKATLEGATPLAQRTNAVQVTHCWNSPNVCVDPAKN